MSDDEETMWVRCDDMDGDTAIETTLHIKVRNGKVAVSAGDLYRFLIEAGYAKQDDAP